MRWLIFLSVFTIGLNRCVITSDIFDEGYSMKDDPQFESVLLASSKYGLLSFVSSRVRARRQIEGVSSKLPHIENKLKEFCGDNKELDDAIQDMKTCLRTKQMFVAKKDVYIQHMNTCSTKTRQLLQKCLPTKLQYFPDFFFKLVESVVKLLYDDFNEIIRGVAPCMSKLKRRESRGNYENCIAGVGQDVGEEMLESKEMFCDKFIQASECFVKQLNDTCTTNTNLEKFKKDYIEAMKRPCA